MIMTSKEKNLNFGPPPPITKLTTEQDLRLRLIKDQLNKDEAFPKADDLLEAKAGIISHADLVLGVGGDIHSTYRNVTTIKARRHPALAEFLINFNFNDLTFDYENYSEEQ